MPVKRFDPRVFLARVGNGKAIRKYQTGEIIFRQGEPADTVNYIQSGSVKETVISEQGKEVTIGILDAKQFFGTSGLDGSPTRSSSTRAIRPSIITTIDNAAMKRALEDEPSFNQMFMAFLLHHNTQIEAEKLNLLFNKSEKRLAQVLLSLARVTEGPAQPIARMVTQAMLADMISTTRPYVNKVMRKFHKLGMIEYSQGIKVNESLLTAVLKDEV